MACGNGSLLSDLARVHPLVLCVLWVSFTVRAVTSHYFHCRLFMINRLVYKLSKHALSEPKMTVQMTFFCVANSAIPKCSSSRNQHNLTLKKLQPAIDRHIL